MTTSLRAAVAFQKVAGTLTLDRDSNLLQWYPSSSTSNVQPFNLRLNDVSGLSMSKPGSAQVALMLVLSEGHQVAGKPKLLLTFNSDQGTSIQDRETFKVEIASVIASNRQSSRTVTSSNPSAAVAPSSSPSNSKTTTTTMTIDRSKTSTPTPPSNSVSKRQGEKDSNGNSRSNSTRPSPTPRATVPPAKSEIELRVMVLKSNPSLLSLHKDVVGGGSMPDSEFWSHPQRKAMIRAERARQDQRKGRNAMLADPKPTPNEAGEMKLSITPQLIRDMFEQYPVVARAYEENVPEKLDEASFWTRYFQSKLYHRLRTSARSTASQHTMQDDPILDAYLEEEDDGLESRQHHVARNRLLDLGATEEDHQETGNEKDWTMRAGAERRTLPLMRRFNVHSQSLLDSALGQQGEEEEEEEGGTGSNSRKKRRTNGKARGGGFEEEPSPTSQSNVKDHQEAMNNNPYYPEIVIQDLEERRETEKVRLEIGQLESFFKTSTSNTTETLSSSAKSQEEMRRDVEMFHQRLVNWEARLGSFKPSRNHAEVASKVMVENIRSRSRSKASFHQDHLPDQLQKQLISSQAAATEFLRQFWSAITPPPPHLEEEQEDAEQGPERRTKERHQRILKAQRMVTSLRKSRQRLENVQEAAALAQKDVSPHLGGLLVDKVRLALGPTQRSIDKAISLANSLFPPSSSDDG